MEQDDSDPTSEQVDELMAALEQDSSGPGAESPAAGAGEVVPISPTLLSLEGDRRPSPLPVCAACPKSLWHATATSLQCYCRAMHVVSWTSEDPQPIVMCDGVMMEEE